MHAACGLIVVLLRYVILYCYVNEILCYTSIQLIAEVDHTNQKLTEFLRRRHVEDATRSFPLLPLILLVPEDCDPDTAAIAKLAPGVDILLQHPYSANDVFEAVVNVLNKVQSVQNVYSDIHKFKESRKYTHLPIFDDERPSRDVAVDRTGGRGQQAVADSILLKRVAEASDEDDDDESSAASEVSVESVDSDIVPEFLIALRREKHFSHTKTFDRVIDPRARAALDSSITKSLRAKTG